RSSTRLPSPNSCLSASSSAALHGLPAFGYVSRSLTYGLGRLSGTRWSSLRKSSSRVQSASTLASSSSVFMPYHHDDARTAQGWCVKSEGAALTGGTSDHFITTACTNNDHLLRSLFSLVFSL